MCLQRKEKKTKIILIIAISIKLFLIQAEMSFIILHAMAVETRATCSTMKCFSEPDEMSPRDSAELHKPLLHPTSKNTIETSHLS
jgi:hypothetical protein